ncbi:MAG: hypothetical protein Ct9H300mP1_16570 [Planctomycetaceae bacterium]|nr:MAG: hypothetical protein Ct9H300mP1_16570 [Planctomycetaceae bacterium]
MIDDHLVAPTKGAPSGCKCTGLSVAMLRWSPTTSGKATRAPTRRSSRMETATACTSDLCITRWAEGKLIQGHPPFTCYAESRDGIHWTKPNLGLVEFEGSKGKTTLSWPTGRFRGWPSMRVTSRCSRTATQSVFLPSSTKHSFVSPGGERPVRVEVARRLSLFHRSPNKWSSPTGIRLREPGPFWDSARGEYRAYFCDFPERDSRNQDLHVKKLRGLEQARMAGLSRCPENTSTPTRSTFRPRTTHPVRVPKEVHRPGPR